MGSLRAMPAGWMAAVMMLALLLAGMPTSALEVEETLHSANVVPTGPGGYPLVNVREADPGAFDILPVELQEHFQRLIQNAIDTCPDNMLVKNSVPCLEGHVYAEQALYYHRIATSPLHRTMCEIGFNAGHSSAAFLSANPEAQLVSFDLLGKPYSHKALNYIGQAFQYRHFFIGGDSTVTVPRVHASYPWLKCDLISVDGGHDDDVPYKDLLNFEPYAHCDTTLVMDDANSPIVMGAWKKLIADGVIREVECHMHHVRMSYASYEPIPRGWCVGKYARAPCMTQAQKAAVYDQLQQLQQKPTNAATQP